MRFLKSAFLILSLVSLSPVSLFAQKSEMMTIKVYFTDSKNNPNMEDCGKVRAVKRTIPKTKAVAKAALNELFKGPTKNERDDGLFSFFSSESKSILRGINLKNGNAYVNFDNWVFENLGNATTSCGATSFHSEIETTLRQFPTIKNIYYAIEKDSMFYYDWMQVGECPGPKKNCESKNFIDTRK